MKSGQLHGKVHPFSIASARLFDTHGWMAGYAPKSADHSSAEGRQIFPSYIVSPCVTPNPARYGNCAGTGARTPQQMYSVLLAWRR